MCAILFNLQLPVPVQSITLQEPTFKEVVVLYRCKQKLKPSSSSSKTLQNKASSEDRMKGILGYRNLHLRCFRDIPMADIDLIFPEKKVCDEWELWY